MADTDTAITRPVPSARHADTAPPVHRKLSSRLSDRASVSAPPEPVHEFPGCRPVHISRDAIADHEGRIEFWDADTETAMVCEPTTIYHEHPSQRLAQMTALIAVTRGAPIDTLGTADLLLRDERGERRRILQADQTVYLHVDRDVPGGSAMVVGEDVLPDVVLEVDHTTDARRGKLALYESWGLREVWVDVPEAAAQSRPANRPPGLTIYVLEPDGYSTAYESRAFPGWRAAEIHRAMHEPTFSAETIAVLERIGRTLRDREGRESSDGPFLRRRRGEIREQGRAEGRKQGHAGGREQGRAEGREQGHAEGREQARAAERARLCRQAALRFDAGTAERLAALIAGVDNAALLTTVGDWIVVCATGAELLERVQRT